MNMLQRLPRRRAIRTTMTTEGELVSDRCDANLEELVQICAGNAQVLEPLQQRQALILCLRQHTEVELDLRQLAIDEVRGIVEILGVLAGSGGFFGFDGLALRASARRCIHVGHHAGLSTSASRGSTRSRGKITQKRLPLPTSLCTFSSA